MPITPPLKMPTHQRMLITADVCAVAVTVLGVLAILGWNLGIPEFASFVPGGLEMKINTAIGFIICGVGLWLLREENSEKSKKAGKLLSLFPIILGTATLFEHLTGWNLGIDTLLMNEAPGAIGTSSPGRMAPVNAASFILKGLSLRWIDWELSSGRRPSQYLSLMSTFFPLQVLVAMALGTKAILEVGDNPYFSQMAIPSLFCWVFLTIGSLCARPSGGFMGVFSEDSTVGKTARRTMIIASVAPMLLAWLLMFGLRSNIYHQGFVSSVFAVAAGYILGYLAWANAQSLKQAEIKLTQLNEQLQQFASIASHDLQEPLRMVAAYLTLLERHSGKHFDAAAKEYLEFAHSGAKRMSLLITDLLKFSKTGTPPKMDIVDMNSVVKAAIQNLSKTIDETNAEVITKTTLPRVIGSDTLLIQLMQNLIGNSLKYRKKDEKPVIEIGYTHNHIFFVKDNGIGFDSQYASSIFETFKRLHPRTEYEGSGLGLATCKRIIEHHGGKIWADSEPGVGATFCFTLPQR